MTAAGWKLGEVQDQDEGHDHRYGDYCADDKLGVSVVVRRQMLGRFVHGLD